MAADELSVSMADMAAAAKSVAQDAAAEQAITSAELAPELEATIDVPDSNFWDSEDSQALSDMNSDIANQGSDFDEQVSEVPSDRIFKYKSNGEEVEVDLSSEEARAELAKKLAAADGVKKAFSDKNKLQQQLKALKQQAEESNKYKESWDKLEALKDNPERLYEIITGQSFDSMMQNQLERRAIYQNASEEERKIMDYEDRIRKMEIQNERASRQREKEMAEAQNKHREATKKETQTKLEREFFKYEFGDSDPASANKLRKILWRSALGDLQDYQKEGYKLSDKLVQKAFSDNAKALQSFYGKEVAKGVKQATDKMTADATEKAQIASTRNYTNHNLDSLSGKDPMSIFRAFQRK